MKARIVICSAIVLALSMFIGSAALARQGEIKIDTKDRVEFHSGTTSTDRSGKPTIIINAQVFKPAGDGPFPALVLLHDCYGLHVTHKKWAERLVEWGYIALLVDSLGPRGIDNCVLGLSACDIANDAYGALNYLESLDFVDANRVGLIGWSRGGSGTLSAVSSDFQEFFNIKRKFKVAIAYYPVCPSWDFYTPVLVFFGDNDVLQSYFLSCKELVKKKTPGGKSFEMKIYPGASHAFDYGLNVPDWLGKPITYDPVAEKDAIETVKRFLDKHF